MKKYILLDRDGVINIERKDYVKSWDEFVFIKGVKKAIKLLNDNNFEIIIVTNQSAVGRGIISEEQLLEIHKNMLRELKKSRCKINSIYYCPHHPEECCNCRKPKPGMLIKAAEDLNFDLNTSILIGDSDTDIIAGKSVGCKTYKVDRSHRLIDIVKEILSKKG